MRLSRKDSNVDNRNLKVMTDMTKDIFEKLFADRGYISKALSDFLYGNEIQLIAKLKKYNLSQTNKILLRKRANIESGEDKIKNIRKIQYARHRSINNSLINLMPGSSSLLLPHKPSLNIQFEKENTQLQINLNPN